MTPTSVTIHAPLASASLAVPPEPTSGGAEHQMTLLAAALARSGRSVSHIVHSRPNLPAAYERVRIVPRSRSRVGSVGGGPREVAAIWGALRRAGGSTVVHRSAGAEAGVVGIYCRLARRRFIYSASSTVDFTGETLAHRPRDLRLHRLGVRLAHRVVVQTQEQRELALALVGAEKIRVIPSFAEQAQIGERSDAFVWAGAAAPYKRPGAFLDLAAAVPDARFVLVLSGREAADHALPDDGLRSRAAGLPNLELHGPMPRPALLALLDRAVAIVNTSEIEGMPNTFLEAWSRGVPALSLTIDPDEMISRHGLGVCAGGSWEEFVAETRRLWTERPAARERAEAIQAHVRARHGGRAVAARWLELLD